MNLLQMTQFVQAQVGTSADLPWSGPQANTLFSGGNLVATGQYAEFVNFILMAYKQIQLDQDNWNWRIKQGTLSLTATQNVYTLTQIQAQVSDYDDIAFMHFIDDTRYLLVYNPTIGVGDQSFCFYIPYQDWRGWKDRNVLPTGKPVYFTRRNDYSLEFSPVPDKTYTVNIDYKMAVDVLAAADTSTPATMPAQYHEAICWRAIAYWAQQRENGAKYEASMGEYNRIMNRMEATSLPDIVPYTREYFG